MAERVLTENEIQKEVDDIRTRPWPRRLVPGRIILRMKNLYNGRFGFIEQTPAAGIVSTVFTYEDGTIYPVLGEDITFSSLETMVEAGWVVD